MKGHRRQSGKFLTAALAALTLTIPTLPVLADPPPHAPAHGYRHKQFHGHDLVFDSHLGVYVVADLSDHYFHDGLFFRWTDGNWYVNATLDNDDGWKRRGHDAVPPVLGQKYRAMKRPGQPKAKAKNKE